MKILLELTLFLFVSEARFYEHDPPVVRTRSGPVQGFAETVYGKTVYSFLGIPYAEPPTGEYRFRRPIAKEKWNRKFYATKKPNSCYQIIDEEFGRHRGVEMWNPNTKMNEDCLYLNIWTPNLNPGINERLVTMIWIFGGGFYGGSSTLDIYDGRTLAAKNNVIVASMNYRVGALGFLYFDSEQVPGNVGLLDQQLALQWFYDNVELFGGDRHRITLFGESAGAASVSFHLLAPGSRNLFQYAIMESASALSPWAVKPRLTAYKRSLQLAQNLNCPTPMMKSNDNYFLIPNRKQMGEIVRCMRAASAEAITNEQFSVSNRYFEVPVPVTVDNYFFPKHPHKILLDREMKKTNILTGSNTDEGGYFLLYGLSKRYGFDMQLDEALTQHEFEAAVHDIFKTDLGEVGRNAVIFHYADSQYNKNTFREILDDITGDYEFICPTVGFADIYADNGMPVYMYHFAHRTMNNPWPEWLGVIHGYEVDYVFGAPLNRSLGYTNDEKLLSIKIMEFFSNFAKTGNPNTNRTDMSWSVRERIWQEYSLASRTHIVFDTWRTFKNMPGRRFSQCRFWNSYIPELNRWEKKQLKAKAVVQRCSSNSMFTFTRPTAWTFIILIMQLFFIRSQAII